MKNMINRFPLISTSAAIAATSLLAMTSTSASASSSYYTCDAPTSCTKVDKRIFTSSYGATKYPMVLVHGFLG